MINYIEGTPKETTGETKGQGYQRHGRNSCLCAMCRVDSIFLRCVHSTSEAIYMLPMGGR